MSIFAKILGGGTVEKITNALGSAIDKTTTSDEEKGILKNDLTNIVLNSLVAVVEAQKEVLLAEMKGNWIQRSWRPMIMLTFGSICVIACFYDVKLNKVPEDFWSLLKIGIGGYVGGRTLEKVSSSVTKNIDLPFLKKKDREV